MQASRELTGGMDVRHLRTTKMTFENDGVVFVVAQEEHASYSRAGNELVTVVYCNPLELLLRLNCVRPKRPDIRIELGERFERRAERRDEEHFAVLKALRTQPNLAMYYHEE